MPAGNSNKPSPKQNDPVAQFNDWKGLIEQANEQIQDHLNRGEYPAAMKIITILTQEQAKMDVRMRRLLIRQGLLKREDD